MLGMIISTIIIDDDEDERENNTTNPPVQWIGKSSSELKTSGRIWKLVGGLPHFLFSIVYGIIIPTDFHIFKMVKTTNQKVFILRSNPIIIIES